MILKYFSDYLKETGKTATFEELSLWVREKLEQPAKCHEDKIIQAEIYLAENENGDFCLVGKNKTGRNLVKSVYHYVLSCRNITTARLKHSENRNN